MTMTSPPSPARTGVWIGIATITMSFAAYTSALVVRQGAASDWQHFRLPPLLYLNTLLLLASSGTLELGRRRILAERRAEKREGPASLSFAEAGFVWVRLTLGMGLLFIGGQIVVWRKLVAQGLFLASNPSSSFFYVFTGLHALHLVGGIVALGWVLARLHRWSGKPPLAALGAVSLYWHFMGVLWLYLLLVLMLRL
jgi:cytochrome c oxidase subunit 3